MIQVNGKMISQEQQILEWLKDGHTLTPMAALNIFGCFRLGARIYGLKKKGYNIHTKIITIKNKKRVAEYSLIPKNGQIQLAL